MHIDGSTVLGGVTVRRGGNLGLTNYQVEGDVLIRASGGIGNQLENSVIGRNLTIVRAAQPATAVIGNQIAGDVAINRNEITGTLDGTEGGLLMLLFNTVGGNVEVKRNLVISTPAGAAGLGNIIGGNTITGTLLCTRNDEAPKNLEMPNSAGSAEGQCEGL